MSFEPLKVSEVRKKLLDAGFGRTEILRTVTELIIWLAGVGMVIPLSAIERKLELMRTRTETYEPTNSIAAVQCMVDVGWGVTCEKCRFADDSTCPYFETREVKFCSAVFEDFVFGLESRGFNISKQDSETLARDLLELDQPEMGNTKDFNVKFVRLLPNGVMPGLKKPDDIRLEDSGPESSWRSAQYVISAASKELCLSSIGGWWVLQEPFRSVLTQKIRLGLGVKAVLAVIPPYGNFRRRLIEYDKELKRIGCEITRIKYPSGRFLQMLIADKQETLFYFRDMESNNLYDPRYTKDPSVIDILYKEFTKSFRKESLWKLFVHELAPTSISQSFKDTFDLQGIVVAAIAALVSIYFGFLAGGMMGALGGVILGAALGGTAVKLGRSIVYAFRKRQQQT